LVFGWGSTNGILCLIFPTETADNPISKAEKARLFHAFLEQHLKDHPDLARVCGWKNENGVLVSCHFGLPFSYMDTEHILCKIWLAFIHSHASRNISNSKDIFVAHCYPLCERGEWEDGMQEDVLSMLEAFHAIKEEGKYAYPTDLMFDSEREPLLKK
jgi:hypothetical protein